ncbi:hypothetical protein BDK51DRAFT_31024, partial [Blyttiomyces helicus]
MSFRLSQPQPQPGYLSRSTLRPLSNATLPFEPSAAAKQAWLCAQTAPPSRLLRIPEFAVSCTATLEDCSPRCRDLPPDFVPMFDVSSGVGRYVAPPRQSSGDEGSQDYSEGPADTPGASSGTGDGEEGTERGAPGVDEQGGSVGEGAGEGGIGAMEMDVDVSSGAQARPAQRQDGGTRGPIVAAHRRSVATAPTASHTGGVGHRVREQRPPHPVTGPAAPPSRISTASSSKASTPHGVDTEETSDTEEVGPNAPHPASLKLLCLRVPEKCRSAESAGIIPRIPRNHV